MPFTAPALKKHDFSTKLAQKQKAKKIN